MNTNTIMVERTLEMAFNRGNHLRLFKPNVCIALHIPCVK